MKARAGRVLALLTRAGSFGAACAVASIVATTSPQARPLDKVTGSKSLVVAVYRDFAPWSFEENGEAKGIDVEIARLLAQRLGVEPKFLVRMAGEDVDGDLRANVWRGDIVDRIMADVMLHVPVDPDLAHKTDMVMITGAYAQERMAIALDPEAVPVKSWPAFRTRRLTVELDSTADIWLSAAYGGVLGPRLDRGRTFADAVERFRSGAADALAAPRAQAEWAVRVSGRRAVVEEWPMPGIVRTSWPIGVAVRFDSRDLGYELEQQLGAMAEDGSLKAIHDRYGVTWLPPER